MHSRYLLAVAIVAFGWLTGPVRLPETFAKDKQSLTEAEIYKMDSISKDFVIDLFSAGVWKKDHDEYRLFTHFEPNASVRIANYDRIKAKFTSEVTDITGAEYRRALVTAKAFGNYNKLDDEGKKRVNMEFFGQETRPERGSEKHKFAGERLKVALAVVGGEVFTRPVVPSSSDRRP
jgi:hypothetical protein